MRSVAGAAFVALILTVARLLLSAAGVGVPIGGHAGWLRDVLVLVAEAAGLAGLSLLALGARHLPRPDPATWPAHATRRWDDVRQRSGRPTLLALAGLFAAGVFVSLYRVGTPSLILDEYFYRAAGLAYVAHGDFALNHEQVFFAKDLFGVSQLIFGSGLTAARVPAALAGLLTGVVLFAFGRRVAGLVAGAAAFAAWTLLPHPIYGDFGNLAVIRMERYALLDPVMVLFLTIALACGWRWIQTGGWRWAVWCGLAGGLSAASKLTVVCVLPGIALCGVLMASDRRRSLRQAAAIAASVVLVVLVSYLPPLGNSPSSFGDLLHFQRLHEQLGHAVLIAGHVYHRAPWWAHLYWMWHSVGPVTTGVLLALALTAPFYVGWRLGLYLWVAILAPLVYLSFFVGFGLPHYYLIWMAPFTLLAALGWASLWRGGVIPRLASGLLAIPLVIAMVTTIANVATLRPNDYAAAGQLLRRDGLARGRIGVWFAPQLLTEYVPNAQVTSTPQAGRFFDAIVVDRNYATTIANRTLRANLDLTARNFVPCKVQRLTVYVRVRPAAARRAIHVC